MDNSKQKILIVDDSAINRVILSDILEDKFSVLEASDGIEAIQMIKQYSREISLILLDLVMPNMDGLEVLAAMNRGEWIDIIPVIMISSENSPTYVERAYELGATDFINRPFNVSVVRKRVANTIMLYTKQRNLIDLVSQQVFEKEKNNNLMINILSHIVEFRNGESGMHILHVNTITEVLLKRLIQKTDKYNLSENDISTIVTASSLHDIGKISVPDEILNKPGKLTDEEFALMKTHSKIGADMLGALTEYQDEKLIKTAKEICLSHHERFDGRGYPNGLSGEDIPISAQVVAMADVYDALTSERCYKSAIPHKKAVEMIVNGECGSFNPLLIECLKDVSDYLEKEMKINSFSARNLRQVKKTADEMLNTEKFSVASNSINYLEQERIKYEFYASMSQEIQYEYTFSPSILSISEYCADRFGLPQIIVNPSKCEKLLSAIGGEDMMEYFTQQMMKTTPEDPVTQFTIQLRINGELRLHRVYCRVNWSRDERNEIVSTIGKIVDIENEHQKMLSLERKAFVDNLTNVYNRAYSVDEIKKRLINNCNRNFALILFDIDDFKIANDTYGHMFGDKVLKSVADLLVHSTRSDDIVARIGGDEFMIFLEFSDNDVLKSIVSRIHDRACKMKCESFSVSLSVGISTTMQKGYDYDSLFNSADAALYHSKRTGKGKYTFYDSSLKLENAQLTPINSDE